MSETSFFRGQKLINFAENPCYDEWDREMKWRVSVKGNEYECKRK